jgi:hypothetical protein
VRRLKKRNEHMNDAFERRALLLHLGDVLEAVNRLLRCGDGHKTVRELVAENDSLARLALLRHVSPRMTSGEFVQHATSAFVAWPRELLQPELNREGVASTVQRNLFAGNAEGWRAYVAGLRGEVPWFGVGLQSVMAGVSEAASGDVERNDGPAEGHRENNENRGRIYPSWPWSPDV